MKLNGTARGRNQQELLDDAHRQAKLFFGDQEYELKIGNPRVDAEYMHFADGSVSPTRTSFDMDFQADSNPVISDERTIL